MRPSTRCSSAGGRTERSSSYREDWPVRYQAERDVHVHIWRSGRDDERRLLLFRDRLRSSAEARTQYEEAKRSLAGRYRDVNYYAEAKSTVIEGILRGPSRSGDVHRLTTRSWRTNLSRAARKEQPC